ncbi:MAG: class F sortase [Chloroflexota bacterium]
MFKEAANKGIAHSYAKASAPGLARQARPHSGTLIVVCALLALLATTDRRPVSVSVLVPHQPVKKAFAVAPLPTATPVPTPMPTPTQRPLKRTASYILSATSPEPVREKTLPPLRLSIGKIGVDAPIVPTGLDTNGEMEAPDNPSEVGWYQASSVPGEVGNAILSGHLDWKTETAVFWRLRELRPGDSIEVYTAEGIYQSFTVIWVQLYPNDAVPLTEILARSLRPTLTIITCAGKFDRSTLNYSHRLIVRARKT